MLDATKEPPAKPAWRERALDAAGVAFVALFGLKITWGLSLARDVGLNDEAIYMASGVRLFQPLYPNAITGLPYAQDGPLYSVWYRALDLFVPNRVHLFYVNQGLLFTLIGVATWLLLRATGVRRAPASVAVAWLLTMRLFEQWSFTTFFSGVLLVFGAWVASRRKTVRGALVALVAAFSIAGWARPENCTSALLVLAVASIVTVRTVVVGAVAPRRAVLDLGAALAPGALLFAIFGWPLGGGRSFYAFGQHYSWNVVQREHLDVNPWSDWLTYVHRDFGDVTTIGQALSRNPSAFLANVVTNLHEYPRNLAGVAAPMLGLPPNVEIVLQVVSVVALAAGIVGALVHVREARTSPALAVAYVAFFAAFATNALSAVLVYPRPHYLVPVVALAMPLVARGLRLPRVRDAGAEARVAPALAAWVVLLALAPNLAHGWTPYSWLTGKLPPPHDVHRVRTIERLLALGVRGPVVSLEPEWGYAFLAGIPFERYAQWDKDRPFDEFVQAHGIDLIIVDYTLRTDERFRNDPEFARFVADPARLGFQVFPVDGGDAWIAVRRGGGDGRSGS